MESFYVVSLTNVSISAIKTLIQIAADDCPLEIIRIRLGQRSGTSIAMIPVQLRRKTVAATVTPFTPIKLLGENQPDSHAVGGAALTGVNASGEGTDGDILIQGVFNSVNEWIWTPQKEKIWVPPTGIIGFKFPAAPSAANFDCDVTFKEYQ